MLTTPPSRWAVQGFTFALWALAAASAVYWGLKFQGQGSAAPAVPVAAGGPVVPDTGAVARLLGAAQGPAVAVNVANRFSLVGVAARPSQSGVALIAVDGKPPRPYRVGSTVEEGLVLQAVEPKRARLGPARDGPAAVTLEMPVARAGSMPMPPPRLGGMQEPPPAPGGPEMPAVEAQPPPPQPVQRGLRPSAQPR